MLQTILSELQPLGVHLIAVSKTKSNEAIMELYAQGQRAFGENYVQELLEKQAALPKDIEWHFIGHLQTNKIKYIANFVNMIHSADSLKMLQEIDKQAKKQHRIINVLLQFHIAEESTKFGLKLSEAVHILETPALYELKNIRICGVMGMATFTDDIEHIRKEFRHLKQIFEVLKTKYFNHQDTFKQISMGMSDDYRIAIAEGSTMVRIGSLLFGKRF